MDRPTIPVSMTLQSVHATPAPVPIGMSHRFDEYRHKSGKQRRDSNAASDTERVIVSTCWTKSTGALRSLKLRRGDIRTVRKFEGAIQRRLWQPTNKHPPVTPMSNRNPLCHRPRQSNAFTLIEVVVVVSILVLLAGVLVPIVSGEISKARSSRAQTDMKALADSFSRYFAHTGAWPGDVAAFNPTVDTNGNVAQFSCLYSNVFNTKGWSGPYLNSGFRSAGNQWVVASIAAAGPQGTCDPWGRFYQYYTYRRNGGMGVGGGIVFVCVGENGQLESSRAQMANGIAGGDDIVQIVTRRL